MSDIKDISSGTASGLNIIYVDDDADDRTFFTQALEKLGLPHRCKTVSSCENLFDVLQQGSAPCDMIFLDINMPVSNGNECLKRIKSDDRFRNIPVVIFSVSQSPTDIDLAYSLGAHYHVIKPHAQINYLASLRSVFNMDWTTTQPVPPREEFVINYAYR